MDLIRKVFGWVLTWGVVLALVAVALLPVSAYADLTPEQVAQVAKAITAAQAATPVPPVVTPGGTGIGQVLAVVLNVVLGWLLRDRVSASKVERRYSGATDRPKE